MADGAVIGKAYVQIIPSTEGIADGLKRSLSGEGTEAGESGGKSTGSAFSKAFKATALVAVTAAAAKVVSTLASSAKAGLESYETLRAGKRTFELLGESSEEASAHVDELKEATVGLSVASADQVKYGQQMKSAWNSVTKSGTDYADVANAITHGVIALGGSSEDLSTVQTQLSQVFATGTMNQQDYNSIMGACPALMNQLAKSMLGADASALDLKEGIQSGKVSIDDLADAMANCDTTTWAESAGDASSNLSDKFTQMKQAVSNAFRDILDYGEEGNTVYDNLAKIIDTLKESVVGVINNAKTFLAEHQEGITNMITTIADNLPTIATILGTLTAIIAGVAAAMALQSAAQAVVTAMNAAEVVSLGQLIAVKLASAAASLIALAPYILIVAAIAALIAIIVICVKHWDQIKAAVISAAQTVKDKAVTAWTSFKAKLEAIHTSMKAKITTVWTAIKTNIINPVVETVTRVKAKFDEMKAKITSAVNTIKSVVTRVFSAVKNAITAPVRAAWSIISPIISKLKNAFNFRWSLPSLKLPHISVSGGSAPFGIGGKGSLPKFSIKWYDKAMDEARILSAPTIFGAMGSSMLGGGESGREVISGEDHLIGLINEAVNNQTAGIYSLLERYLPDCANTTVTLDGKTVSRTVSDYIATDTKRRGVVNA